MDSPTGEAAYWENMHHTHVSNIEKEAKEKLIEELISTLEARSVSPVELRNLLRIARSGAAAPTKIDTLGLLAHYPRHEDIEPLRKAINHSFAKHRGLLIRQIPAMLQAVGRVLRVRLAVCAQCENFVSEHVIERVQSSLRNWEAREEEEDPTEEAAVEMEVGSAAMITAMAAAAFPEDDLGAVTGGSDSSLYRVAHNRKSAWTVFCEFCLLETLCGFVQAQLACLDVGGLETVHEV